jgi:L-2-hydroxyglutarate oxidase LhgO
VGVIVIVGGGVVGLALAVELARHDRVTVLERHDRLGAETSSHSSGVIHAGIYYPAGSLKHRLCIEGNRRLYEWSAAHGVRSWRLGKLIIATEAAEEGELEGLWRQAAANGVPGMSRPTVAQVAALEPSVRCAAAIYSESTGVVDQAAYVASLAAAAVELGVQIELDTALVAGRRAREGFRLEVEKSLERQEVTCDLLVNSAGLAADRVAALLGYDLEGNLAPSPAHGQTGRRVDGQFIPPYQIPRLRQVVNKGRYYDVVNPVKQRLLSHLVYPVPDHAGGGLGVHVVVDIDGRLHFGPDTEWLDDGVPLDYLPDDLRRETFVKAIQRYLPEIDAEDLAPGKVGYRPKLQRPGEDQQDFLVWRDGPYVHLGGIESPGFTASLALARYVAEML